MATAKGLFEFTGTIDGFTFYKLHGKLVVRRTGGFKGKPLKTDPKYARVLENSRGFAHSARIGKYLRSGISSYLKQLGTPFVHSTVVGLCQRLLSLDTLHKRGEQQVLAGLRTAAGRAQLLHFEFDKQRPFERRFPFRWSVGAALENVEFYDFNLRYMDAPAGATGFTVSFFTVGYDFETYAAPQLGPVAAVSFTLGQPVPRTLSLQAGTAPTGMVLGYVALDFYQEINGARLPLRASALKVVAMQEL